MPTLFPLICQTCGSNEIKPIENGLYECKYCHTIHCLVDGTLKRTKDQNTFFGATSVFMELGQLDRATKMFTKILEESPDQSRAYWGLVICQTDRFSRIEITKEEFKVISENAVCAISFASPEEKDVIQKLWDNYSNAVNSYFQEQFDKKNAELKRQEEQRRAEEKARKERKAKEEQLEEYKLKLRQTLDSKEAKTKAILMAISIGAFLIANIVYCIIVFSQNIPGTIHNSPECIAPVVIGGFIAMVITALSCGFFRIPGLGCIPAIINAICVVMMIVGMLSHTKDFFMCVMVVVCFGAVGAGVTALLGWLGVFISLRICDNCNLFDYSENRYNKEYENSVNVKKQELGL